MSTAAWGREKAASGSVSSRGLRRHPGWGKLATQCLLQGSREKFFSFQPIWTKLGMPTGSPRRGPPTNFEENPTTLRGLQRLKAKLTRKNLTNVDQIYTIFVPMYHTRFLKIWRKSNKKWRSREELCGQLTGISCIIMLYSMAACFWDIGKIRQRTWTKVSWIFHSNVNNPLTSNLHPIYNLFKSAWKIIAISLIWQCGLIKCNTIAQKASHSGTWSRDFERTIAL